MSAALAQTHNLISPDEYLEIDRAAERKSEYFDGEMFLMAGASREHNRVAMSLSVVIGNQLRGRPCEPFGSDTRVKIPNKNFCFPDLSIACKPEWEDKKFDILLNPVVIFEILSPSNEAWDRGGKFHEYQRLSSLREYVLISQDKALIEIYSRRDVGWLLRSVEGREESITLESVENLTLPLAEVYERVVFEDEASELFPNP